MIDPTKTIAITKGGIGSFVRSTCKHTNITDSTNMLPGHRTQRFAHVVDKAAVRSAQGRVFVFVFVFVFAFVFVAFQPFAATLFGLVW